MTPLFAFWKYDRYPYCLGAEIVEVLKNGVVKVKGYSGMHFKPFLILPLEQGIELQNELKELEYARGNEMKKVEDKFKNLCIDTFKKCGHKYKI